MAEAGIFPQLSKKSDREDWIRRIIKRATPESPSDDLVVTWNGQWITLKGMKRRMQMQNNEGIVAELREDEYD